MDNLMVLINILAIVDILIIGTGFILGHYFYQKKFQTITQHTVNAISALLDESADIGSISAPVSNLTPFYDKLKEVAGVLSVRENNRKEVLNIANSIAINMELSTLLDDLLPKIVRATDSSCAAFYMANHATNKLEIKASIGFSKNLYGEFDMTIGEGMIGSATKDVNIINDIPDDSVFIIKTYLGKIKPKSIMVIPIVNNDRLVGILTLASIYNYREEQNEIIDLIRYYVGISVGNAVTYEQTKRLTNELRFQNTLIQNLNEDLEKRVDNRTIFLNNIIDSIMDYAIFAIDSKHSITAWNKGAELMLGFSKDDVLGKNAETVISNLNSHDRLKVKIETAIREGRYEESGWSPKKDGNNYFYESLLFPMYDSEKKIMGFTNIIKDITYLKNVEKALGYERDFTKKVLEAGSSAIVVTSSLGIIEMANSNSEEILSKRPLKGVDLCEFFLDPEYLRQSLKDVAERYGKGEWNAIIKEDRRRVMFNVYVLMDSSVGEPKLFLYLSE